MLNYQRVHFYTNQTTEYLCVAIITPSYPILKSQSIPVMVGSLIQSVAARSTMIHRQILHGIESERWSWDPPEKPGQVEEIVH